MGIKDLCVYWFRKTQDHLKPGQRAGLVGTNSISQNRARSASLEYIVANGGVITDAVSSQKWPGAAKVHVSIVNWVKEPGVAPTELTLDGETAIGINPSLRSEALGAWEPVVLTANKERCFQGPIPVGSGFVVTDTEATGLLALSGVSYRKVVRPYLTGEDISESATQEPQRWIIDFGLQTLEAATKYPLALKILRERVKPVRESNNRALYRKVWWLFGENRPGLRKATSKLDRVVAGVRVGKRALFTWADAWVLPSDSTNTFAFDDDFSMGVLLSKAHEAWAWQQASTLKGDLRYTPTSVFMTFPWPDPVSSAQRDAVADLSRAIIKRRQEICRAENCGLTRLYNLVDDGAYTDFKKMHKQLDEAVAACYGWPRSLAQDAEEIVLRLTKLNMDIAKGVRGYKPFQERSSRVTPERPTESVA